jgi:hypothetical protein
VDGEGGEKEERALSDRNEWNGERLKGGDESDKGASFCWEAAACSWM